MLHTKFRGYRPTGSGEEDFEGFLYGRGGHLGWSSSCYMYTKFRGNRPIGSGEEDF